jgi:hypothetical protein
VQHLTALVRLLDATSDDRWLPGHPSARPRLSAADRTHDATRPADPTADTATDPARLDLAHAWADAMAFVQSLCRIPRGPARDAAVASLEWRSAWHATEVLSAHDWWAGPQ